MTSWQIICADVLDGLRQLPDESVQTVVTSPPYWGLRDYGVDGAIGLEPTPEAYVSRMVDVFREVRRVLRSDGTCWVNLGDAYSGFAGRTASERPRVGGGHARLVEQFDSQNVPTTGSGLLPKNLVGIPWRVAFALQADGWYLRSDVIWAKPNPMPESVTDRPTKAHEYVFLLTKRARYFYDADGVREPLLPSTLERGYTRSKFERGLTPKNAAAGESYSFGITEIPAGRNLRSVWSIPTEPFPEAHFATFPKALVVPCVKAGTSEKGCCPECGAAWVRQTNVEYVKPYGTADSKTLTVEAQAAGQNGGPQGMKYGRVHKHTETTGWTPSCSHDLDPVPCTVLDPFAGSGTVGVVALRHGRSFVGIELNPEYAEMARRRIADDAPLFNVAAEVSA